ncbi:hypothetical protein ABZ614_18330 [Streptomyces sp. NPDC013178]|uniref:hypothetical protein n=1 Tax=Streptomyces sp. NPDC013178 TaxID=3155118 RepID=UPI0033DFD5CC
MVTGAASPNGRGGVGSPDPEQIETLAELAAALRALRGTRSYSSLEERSALGRSTISEMLNAKSKPTEETLVAYLTACGVKGRQAQAPWLRARERVETGHLRRPAHAVRIREARPLLLGVHPSIRVEDERDTTELPAYVPRDFDDELRAAVTTAAGQGGFVLLIGDSSVGKTRALFEAVLAELPEWWLIHPDADDGTGLQALAAEEVRRTVVWLDELQDHLDGTVPLTTATTRRLIGAGLVLVGTLWSDEYTRRVEARVPGRPDPHANARKLLDLAHLVRVPEAFTPAERYRAEAYSADRRIRVALDTPDVGFTQFLAAAPQLATRWMQADPYAKALITAALDIRRLGARVPPSRELLAAAVPGYLTPTQQARADRNWLDAALEYATTRLHGAASALQPTGTMGRTTGYLVADYLRQQANRTRRAVPVPDAVWQAVVDHHHPRDAQPLAQSALARGEHRHAEALYRRAADRGDIWAGMQLGKLLLAAGRIEELRARADAGDRGANSELVRLLAREGDLAGLRARSHAGDPQASTTLVTMLFGKGRVEEALSHLRAWADAGDDNAARQIQEVLDEQEGLTELSVRADAGEVYAAHRLAELLVKYGRIEELRARADSGDRYAAHTLAKLLERRGEVGELRARADAGDGEAGGVLADLLAGQGDVDEAMDILRGLAGTGDQEAGCQLADLLAEHGEVDEAVAILRVLTDSGCDSSWYRLANLLAEHGDVTEAMAVLLAQPHAGGGLANASGVADVLAREARIDDLRTLADAGSRPAQERLAILLAQLGHFEELRARAGLFDPFAWHLNALLARSGLFDELRERANAGDPSAEWHLDCALFKQNQAVEDDASDQVTVFLPPWRTNIGGDRPPHAAAPDPG